MCDADDAERIDTSGEKFVMTRHRDAMGEDHRALTAVAARSPGCAKSVRIPYRRR